MLSEGKAEIDKFKKQVEGGVANAKAIYKEVTGLWGWLQGLFGVQKPKQTPQPALQSAAAPQEKPVEKKAKRQPEPELSYEEYKARAVHDIFEHLKVFFEAQRQLKEHCRALEELSKTTSNVADAAIDRIEIEWQLKELQGQISHAMIYGTPESLGLGSLYKDFLRMQEQIVEEQEVERLLQLKKKRDDECRRRLIRDHRIDRAVASVLVLAMVLWMWGFLLLIAWLVKTPNGSLLAWLYSA